MFVCIPSCTPGATVSNEQAQSPRGKAYSSVATVGAYASPGLPGSAVLSATMPSAAPTSTVNRIVTQCPPVRDCSTPSRVTPTDADSWTVMNSAVVPCGCSATGNVRYALATVGDAASPKPRPTTTNRANSAGSDSVSCHRVN